MQVAGLVMGKLWAVGHADSILNHMWENTPAGTRNQSLSHAKKIPLAGQLDFTAASLRSCSQHVPTSEAVRAQALGIFLRCSSSQAALGRECQALAPCMHPSNRSSQKSRHGKAVLISSNKSAK